MSQPQSPPTNPIPGAIYIEDLTGISWVWTGVAWIQAGPSSAYSAQTKTGMAIVPGFYSNLSGSGTGNIARIATQYGPTAPVNPAFGQTWVDTSDANRPITYVWTSPGSWTKTSDGTNNMYVQQTAPTDHEFGDQWYNTSTGELNVWDGTQWRLVSGTGSGGTAIAIQSYAVTPPAQAEGNVVYNTTTDTLYISDGSSWVEISKAPDYDTHSITGLSAPSVKKSGEPVEDGDLWVNTSNQVIKVKAGTEWKYLSSGTAGDAHVFYQSANPGMIRPDNENVRAGDLWINNVTQDTKVWNGSDWVSISVPQADIDTNSTVSVTEPVDDGTLKVGDLWVNETDYRLYYRNYAGAWTPLTSSTTITDTHGDSGSGDPNVTSPWNTGLRGDGATALSNGDQYIDTATNTIYWYSTSTSTWTPISSSVSTAEPQTLGTVYGFTSGDPEPAGRTVPGAGQTFLGWRAGSSTATVTQNSNYQVAIGTYVLDRTATPSDYNVVIGTYAGRDLSGGENVILGNSAGESATNLNFSVLLGTYAGASASSDELIAIGQQAGYNYSGDTHAIAIGNSALANATSPSGNIIGIGVGAGGNSAASDAIAIGYDAGRFVTAAGNNSVVIGSYGTSAGTGATVQTGEIILADNRRSDNVKLRINNFNAFGFPLTADAGNQTVDYGTNGQVLTSQGSLLPPIWSTAGGAEYMGMAQEGAPTTRPDGSALQTGDHYYENSLFEKNSASYYYSGSQWYSAHAVHEEGSGAPTRVLRLAGDALVENDFYIDETNAQLYRWDGGAWQRLSSTDHQQIVIPAGVSLREGFPTTRSDGTVLQIGDTFQSSTSFNGGTYYRTYYYNGSQWMPNGTHNFVDDATPNPAETFAGDTWSAPSLGRFYFAYDTGTGPTWTQIV